jgi:hypothetical protein
MADKMIAAPGIRPRLIRNEELDVSLSVSRPAVAAFGCCDQ